MARGNFAADSSDIVTAHEGTQTLIEKATSFLGQKPVFWGRYFKAPGNTERVQYQANRENQALNRAGIPVLPIARQTNHVDETERIGRFDARGNAEAIIQAFGEDYLASKGAEFFVFLDVEPSTPMSVDYWIGWASVITAHSESLSEGRFKFLPCVYHHRNDRQTIRAINSAFNERRIKCYGVWVARYFNPDDTMCHRPTDWMPEFVEPVIPVQAPLLAWQYIGDCFRTHALDFNQVNPNINQETELLKFLILPPAD